MLRIKGLVRLKNRVRDVLAGGIPADEADAFRRHVRKSTRTVEAICARYDVSPVDLPAPSRKAYSFLKGLDLDRLPIRRSREPRRTTRSAPASQEDRRKPVRVNHLVRIVDAFHESFRREALAAEKGPGEMEALRNGLVRHVAAVDEILASEKAGPAALPAPSRSGYGWMRYLLQGDHLERHVAALIRAFEVAAPLPWPPARPLTLRLKDLKGLYRIRHLPDRTQVDIHEGYRDAPREVWQGIFLRALGDRSAAVRRAIEGYAETERFSRVVREIGVLSGDDAVGTVKGRVHDLAESFRRVNDRMFDGRMPRPALEWSRRATYHKFGHYSPSRDAVVISRSLDDEEVLTFVIDFVLYHELLHKKHGSTWTGKRRIVHTAPFRADERRFPEHEAAKAEIRKIARCRQRNR